MPSYLVELYLPSPSVERRKEAARIARGGASTGVRYLRSIFLPAEDTCFHEYECESGDMLAAALARAEVRYERLISADVIEAGGSVSHLTSGRREGT